MKIDMIIIIAIGSIIILYFLYDRVKRILFLRNDENFKPGAKWPDWLKRDAEEWNKYAQRDCSGKPGFQMWRNTLSSRFIIIKTVNNEVMEIFAAKTVRECLNHFDLK